MIKAIKVNNQIIVGVPKRWVRPNTPNHTTLGYDKLPDTAHFEDGWKEVVTPVIDSIREKLGDLEEFTDRFEYKVLTLTNEQIANNISSNSEAARQAIIDDIIRQQNEATVDAEFQAIEDVEELLSNMDAFPLWTVGDVYEINKKIKYVVNGEMKLFKVNQPTLTADALYPPGSVGTEALYTEVAKPGEIPVFVQPTGAHDAYGLGDKVHFPTENDPIYESLIPANVYSPTAYPQGWQIQE